MPTYNELCNKALRGTRECECCGESGRHAGCTLLPGRIICRRCISVWYDEGYTDPEEIGRESRRWRDDPNHWYNQSFCGMKR